MSTKNTGVSAELKLGNSQFLKGINAAKAAAKSLKQDLAALKAPPLPDIASQPGFKKAQQFGWSQELKDFDAHNRQMVQKLRERKTAEAAVEKQAADLAARRRVHSGGRVDVGGQWSHLQGTQFAGGSRGAGGGKGGRGNAYGLGVGYNAIQDLVQGGPMAVANNVPQIIELVAKSPALKLLGAAAFAAAGIFMAGKFGRDLYNDTGDRFEKKAGDRYAANRASAEARALSRRSKQDLEAGIASGERASAGHLDASSAADAAVGTYGRGQDAMDRQRAISREIRMIRINAIEDPAERARQTAAEEMKALREKYALEKERAATILRMAGDEQGAASLRIGQIRDELDAMGGAALTPDQIARRAALTGEREGLQQRLKSAKARSADAFTGRDEAAARAAGEMPLEAQAIQARRDAELDSIAAEKAREWKEKQADLATRSAEALATATEDYAKALKDAADRTRQQAEMEKQLEISELTSGGRRSRRAEKMQRGLKVDSAAAKYQEAGYDKETAQKMAEREVAAGERRPGTIRGAGFGGKGAAERASGLDYFDGKDMAKPGTSSLDEYEKRRNIPGVGKSVDKKLADDAKVEVAKPNPKGDPAVVALLKAILGALGGTEPDSSTSSGSGRQTIKGAGYQG